MLTLIQEILPHVAALNLSAESVVGSCQLENVNASNQDSEGAVCTTSNHYTWVQSDHPYKPATVSNYRYQQYFFYF